MTIKTYDVYGQENGPYQHPFLFTMTGTFEQVVEEAKKNPLWGEHGGYMNPVKFITPIPELPPLPDIIDLVCDCNEDAPTDVSYHVRFNAVLTKYGEDCIRHYKDNL